MSIPEYSLQVEGEGKEPIAVSEVPDLVIGSRMLAIARFEYPERKSRVLENGKEVWSDSELLPFMEEARKRAEFAIQAIDAFILATQSRIDAENACNVGPSAEVVITGWGVLSGTYIGTLESATRTHFRVLKRGDRVAQEYSRRNGIRRHDGGSSFGLKIERSSLLRVKRDFPGEW